MSSFVLMSDTRSHRIRARRVDEKEVAKDALYLARRDRDVTVVLRQGGIVAESVKCPPQTEVVVALSASNGDTYVWAGQIPANKVTLVSIAAIARLPSIKKAFVRELCPGSQERRELLQQALVAVRAECARLARREKRRLKLEAARQN